MFTSVDLKDDSELPDMLRNWLSDAETFQTIVQYGAKDLRYYLEKQLPPTEPLLSKIYFGNRLKFFTFPNRQQQGGENVWAHIAAMWSTLSFYGPIHWAHALDDQNHPWTTFQR